MKNKLKIERAILNLTQEELAKQVDVSRQTINSIDIFCCSPSVAVRYEAVSAAS
jgi:putative transcriptional regulator